MGSQSWGGQSWSVAFFQLPWCNYSHPGWLQTVNRTPLAQKLSRLLNNGSAGARSSTPLATAASMAHTHCATGTGQLVPDSQAQSRRATPGPRAPHLSLQLPITSFHHLQKEQPRTVPFLSASNPSSHRCQEGQMSWAGLVAERLGPLTKNSPFCLLISPRKGHASPGLVFAV